MKKALTVLLALLLLLAMAACNPAEDAAAQTDPPPITIESEPTPADIYNEAAAAARTKTSLKLKIDSERSTLVGSQTFMEEESLTLSLNGVGTDDFIGKAVGVVRFGPDYSVMLEEYCFDGAAYGSLEGGYYTAPSTEQDFFARYSPVVLLDPALYESVEFTDDNTIVFSGASKPESWLALEEDAQVEASGTAKLENGQLVSTQYQVTYTYGSTDVTLHITTELAELSDQLELPDVGMRTYLALDDPEIPMILERGYGYMFQSQALSSAMIESIYCAAANATLADQITIDLAGMDDNLKTLTQYNTVISDLYSGPVASIVQEERFADGVYSLVTDGGEPETDTGYSSDYIRNYYLNLCADNYTALTNIDTLTATEVPGGYVFDFTCTDAHADDLKDYACGRILNDPGILDSSASAYTLQTAEGYLAIDACTGLPTAMSVTYAATHTIDGNDYALTLQSTQTMDAADQSAYTTITGEPLPADTESEQPKPLFYQVTSENGETMWLLGTIHVGDGRTGNLPQEIYDAFAASDALAVEFDMNQFLAQLEDDPDLAQTVMSAYLYADGSTITDHLQDVEIYEAGKQVLKFAGEYSAVADMMKPAIWSTSIDNFYLRLGYRLSADYGVDFQLLSLAEEQEKTVLDVESGIAQIQMLTGYSDALQELLLASSLSTNPAEYNAEVEALYELWCSGDEAALIKAIATDTSDMTAEELRLFEEYTKALETDRNADMLEVAKGYLNSGDTVFYAVGLAHLLAEDGLVNTLREAGYTVELVTYE